MHCEAKRNSPRLQRAIDKRKKRLWKEALQTVTNHMGRFRMCHEIERDFPCNYSFFDVEKV
jgi:hypothetical protein